MLLPRTFLPGQESWTLHCGNARAPVAVISDDRHPGMYRLRWSDGTLSDFVNFTRARDSTVAIFERGPPRRDPLSFRWKENTCDSPTEGATCVGGVVATLRPRALRDGGVS
jgi:hypothetical protein